MAWSTEIRAAENKIAIHYVSIRENFDIQIFCSSFRGPPSFYRQMVFQLAVIYTYMYRSIMFRAGWQRETEIPDDRRHQRISHDQRWIRYFVVPRSRVPCPDSKVSRNSWRWFAGLIVVFIIIFFSPGLRLAEPVASARPKLSSTINLIGLATKSNGSLPLFCPAQGFPLPSYR